MRYICDGHRHLVCVPYSIENLHRMAEELRLKRCWFHRDHYDIPKRRVEEITQRCRVVSSREILRIIRGEREEGGSTYRIGQKVWRKKLSPLEYGTATVREMQLCSDGLWYKIQFDHHPETEVRWYHESELAPSSR